MLFAKQIARRLRVFLSEEEGTAASEYAVLLAMIAAAALGVIAVLGPHIAGTTTSVSTGLPSGFDLQQSGPTSTVQSHVTTSVP